MLALPPYAVKHGGGFPPGQTISAPSRTFPFSPTPQLGYSAAPQGGRSAATSFGEIEP